MALRIYDEDDAPFTLQNEPTAPKRLDGLGLERQGSLLTGLGCLPGQADLFDDLDFRGDDAP